MIIKAAWTGQTAEEAIHQVIASPAQVAGQAITGGLLQIKAIVLQTTGLIHLQEEAVPLHAVILLAGVPVLQGAIHHPAGVAVEAPAATSQHLREATVDHQEVQVVHVHMVDQDLQVAPGHQEAADPPLVVEEDDNCYNLIYGTV